MLALALLAAAEVELLAGYMSAGDPKILAVSLRAGFDFDDVLTISSRFTGVPGPPGRSVGGSFRGDPGDVAGMSGWQLLGELRLHTSGENQVHVGFSAGTGRLHTWQCACTESEVLRGHTAFSLQGSAGLRFKPEAWNGFSFAFEVIVPHWEGLEEPRPGPDNQMHPSPQTAWAVLGGVGYRWP
jgi:hypothetical protein